MDEQPHGIINQTAALRQHLAAIARRGLLTDHAQATVEVDRVTLLTVLADVVDREEHDALSREATRLSTENARLRRQAEYQAPPDPDSRAAMQERIALLERALDTAVRAGAHGGAPEGALSAENSRLRMQIMERDMARPHLCVNDPSVLSLQNAREEAWADRRQNEENDWLGVVRAHGVAILGLDADRPASFDHLLVCTCRWRVHGTDARQLLLLHADHMGERVAELRQARADDHARYRPPQAVDDTRGSRETADAH